MKGFQAGFRAALWLNTCAVVLSSIYVPLSMAEHFNNVIGEILSLSIILAMTSGGFLWGCYRDVPQERWFNPKVLGLEVGLVILPVLWFVGVIFYYHSWWDMISAFVWVVMTSVMGVVGGLGGLVLYIVGTGCVELAQWGLRRLGYR
jgi:hypothetical protein